MEGLNNFDSPLYLIKEGACLEHGVLVELTVRAHVPTNSGYFTDVLLGSAALDPNASSQLRELCLSAQNARRKNKIPRRPVKDHWNFLVEEAKIFRNDMRLKRKDFVKVAKEAAACAKWGWKQRRERRRGNRQAWALYLRTTARVENVTEDEAAEDARDLARLVAMQRIDRE